MAFFPYAAAGNNINLALKLKATEAILLCVNVNCFVLDYACRQKTTGMHVNIFTMRQLPVIPLRLYEGPIAVESPGEFSGGFIIRRCLELSYTAWDLQPLAADVASNGPPFRWDDNRRFLIRCEIDAFYFLMYGLSREDVSYVLEAFPIVRRKDEQEFGYYRTSSVILEIYDALVEARRTGSPYQTRLNPPAADQGYRHPKKSVGIMAFGSLITEPGPELLPKTVMRMKVWTPFRVEYARVSRTRGGAPTLVPHEEGGSVLAQILVMADNISFAEATDMLWRRERRREGTGETYSKGIGENSVLAEEFHDDPCVSAVLYTNFNPAGKIAHPTAADLAKRAIESVAAAPDGMDGITYLINAIPSGIATPLTADYKAEVLKQTLTLTLEEALKTVRETQ